MLSRLLSGMVLTTLVSASVHAGEVTINKKGDGYRGVWYQNQPLKSEYKFKYSGGLGTYCAKHKPFAIHCPEVRKTFFCYGGVPADYHKRPELTVGGIGARKTQDALYQDIGKTWQAADGSPLTLPLKAIGNPARIHDYESDGLLVYMKDLSFDAEGRPIVLFVTSKGYESGPKNDPRTWRIARWTGTEWALHAITQSDSNYDMGSLYVESNGQLRIIAPTETGPQAHNPGGEVTMWVSADDGKTWQKRKQLTQGSPHNHTYVRRPVNAHPDFYALWADGHGRKPSLSRLYFANRNGDVFLLPEQMDGEFQKPAAFKP